ncbi:MAG TPA: FkbM family methyltransferase [Vicinamibacterales bacterium]|jgi:FkbM family methyltransferase|nr:FkbM family methyltransferase [Vicinamibacterales bacterium]
MGRRDARAEDPLEEVLAELGSEASVRQRESAAFGRLAGAATRAVVHGCGPLGRIILAGAKRAGLDVVACADNNTALWGQTLDGIPVMSPADAVARYKDDAFFVVGVYNSSAPRKQLRELGCERVVPYAAFFWQFAPSMSNAPGLELPHRILASVDAMRTGYRCLDDEKSRREFAAQIAWRCSLDYDRLPAADPASDIYYPPDLFRLNAEEVLVDCGAFDGDSIRFFLDKTSGAFRHIYACEPDASNRRALDGYLSSLPGADRARVSILPYAIGDRDGLVYFDSSGTAGSHMTTERSTESIDCRRLDTLLKDANPTFIKMDIEGAEPDAIGGATATIRRAKPLLAVCAYHKCEHLWTLPALLKAALPEYRVSLRRYAEECWEMVYYAVPPERVVRGR